MDTDQLRGVYRSVSQLDSGDCRPISSQDGKPFYPCGLIANSVFNGGSAIPPGVPIPMGYQARLTRYARSRRLISDTFPSVQLLNPSGGQDSQTYNFTERGIAWGGIADNYAATPGYDSPSDVLPPPNWAERYPNGYIEFPNLHEDEHFQVWMRIAALPTFRKLWARNDNEVMQPGRYRIVANMNYPVKQFGGTKSIVISTVSWVGGKQPFLGWAYVGAAVLCVVLAVAGLVRHLVKPRKLGDMNCEYNMNKLMIVLSWNR